MKIEGIPDGWELLGVRCAELLEKIIDDDGSIITWAGKKKSSRVFPIIRKIEKPKQYRPFANAAEFEPHRDRWMMHPNEPDKRFKPGDYNNLGVWGTDRRFYDYAQLFESGTLFDDGTPFGVECEVTE